jgi:hypothetical protein
MASKKITLFFLEAILLLYALKGQVYVVVMEGDAVVVVEGDAVVVVEGDAVVVVAVVVVVVVLVR